MVNMKKIKKLLLSFIFLLLLVPVSVLAEPEETISKPNLGILAIYSKEESSRFVVKGENCELTNLAGHEAVCGVYGLHFGYMKNGKRYSDPYNAVECTSAACKELGEYWYAARKAANCDNDDYACLQKLAGVDEKYGGKKYYFAIRDMSRTGTCSHSLCETIKTYLESGKSCKIYEAYPYEYNSGIYKLTNRQPMYVADCDDITTEENNCKDVEGCCVDESKTPSVYYYNGDVVTKKQDFLDKCACTQQPEYKYWILPDGSTADAEQEFEYYCDCQVKGSNPKKYYILDENKTKQEKVDPDVYKKHCKCNTFELYEHPTIYYGPNPPTTVASEADQIKECKEAYVCKYVDGVYYGPGGIVTTEEQYKKDCSCVKILVNGETIYYGPNPPDNILPDEPTWNQECNKKCQKIGETYYGLDGKPLDGEDAYKKVCGCREEEENGNTVYYGPDAESLGSDKNEYIKRCKNTHKCEVKDGVYYGPDGSVLASEAAFKDKCKCRIETDEHGNKTYYALDPLTPVSPEQYETDCPGPGSEHKCELYEGTYYGPEGEELTSLDEWNAQCCTTKYEECCVINNQYYLDAIRVSDKAKCTKCKPFVSYHNTCENPEETEEISFSDGEQVGDLTKTSNEDKESVNYLTYKDVEDDNIVKCVLEKKEDYAGNTLETNIVLGNNYCKVLCKEDFGKFDKDGKLLEDQKYKYGYSVAGMQDANSGRYFRLSAAYNAKKTCYSSSSEDNDRREIDLDLFNKQVFEQINIINDNINEMNLAYVRFNYLKNNRPNSVYDPEDASNPSTCTQAPKYSIETITYTAEGPVQPMGYEIHIDLNKTTNYHISYSIEETGLLDSSVQKYFVSETKYEDSEEISWTEEIRDGQGNIINTIDHYDDCLVIEKTATEILNKQISDYEKDYNDRLKAITDAFDAIESYIEQVKDCTRWYDKMTYDTEPDIGYKYGYRDENGNYDYDYYEKLNDENDKYLVRGDKEEITNIDGADDWTSPSTDTTLKATSIVKNKIKDKLSESIIEYKDDRGNTETCVNDKYSGNRDNGCHTAIDTQETVDYVKMTPGSAYYTLNLESQDLSNKTYTKKNIEVHYEYASPNLYSTLYPSGVVVLRNDSSFDDDAQGIRMKVDFDGLPVQLETESGLHKFTFTFSDVGEYFSHEGEGRVLNAKNHKDDSTVLGKYNNNEKAIFNSDSDYEYLCYYRVNQSNCPTCTPECGENGCETTPGECQGENCCPVCDIECVDCIYSKKEYHINVTSIPLRKPTSGNPNDPENNNINVVNPGGSDYVPYNWNAWSVSEEYGDRYDIVNEKAKLTINEIQTYGELIYVSERLGEVEVFETQPTIEGISSPTDFGVLKVVMTPSLAQKIRNYNDDKSFNDQSLKCYDYTYLDYKFEKIFCYSTFLDAYKDNSNFVFYDRRLSDDNSRSTTNDQNGYWLTFLDELDYGGQGSGEEYASKINDIADGNMSQIGGPSWR